MSMKFTAALLLVACLQVTAKVNSQTITYSATNVPLKKIFSVIKKQCGYVFFYTYSSLEGAKPVTINVKNASLQDVLDISFKDQPFTYLIEDKTIVIHAQTKAAAVLPPQESLQAPPIDIKGRVEDKNGAPVGGASILIKGTQTGSISDEKGNFSLEVTDKNTVLVVSFVGYKTQEINLNGRATIIVQLELEVTTSEEVVVIGYGTKKRENLTGAVSTVTSEVLKSRPITNVFTALQGEIPGVVIQRSTGQPGAEGFDLNVRGYSSTNGGNSPLVLIDGIPGDMSLLNPADIESVSVLKDASASIYGARAANGVFLVTTKKGHKGPPRINYSGNAALSQLTGMMETPNTYQMAIMDNEANIHNGAAPMYTPSMLQQILNNDPNPIPHPLYGGWMLFFTTTDWRKAVFENGYQQTHNINVSGSGNNSTYYLSAGYSQQNGVIKYANDNNKRYNLRLNYDYDFSKHLRLETKVAFEDQRRNDVGGIGASWIMYETIFGMPNVPVYSKDGKFFAQGGWGNAVAQAKEGATATFNTRHINTNFKLIADIVKGLKLNLQAGVNYSTENDEDIARSVPLYNWDGDLAYYTIANPSEASMSKYNRENTYRNFTAYFEYDKTFAGKHRFNLMGGASHEESDSSWFSARRDNFVTEDPWSLNLGGTNNMSNDGGGSQWAISSLFSRLSYSYNDKYLLEASLRYDGSSRFEPGRRWGLFPGVSAAWRLSQEDFIKQTGWFTDLKLRASYGQTGNQEGIGLYDYLQSINISGSYPFGAGGQVQSAALAGMVSLNRTWETLINRNIGIDATMIGSKLNFSFDYFIKTNKNLLIPIAYPSLLGSVAPYSNSGKLETRGFETSIGWKDHAGKLEYSVRLLLSDAQDKVINYGGQDTYVVGLNQVRQGYPINSYFSYVFDGLIRNQKELDDYKMLGGVPNDIGIGDARFKDLDGDGVISAYSSKPGVDGDVKNVGTITPRYNFGINLGAKFRQFDLSVFLQGVGKRTMFRTGEYSMPWSDWWRQPPLFYYGKTWNEDRPDAKYPRLSYGNIRYWNYQASTLQEINGAYIRLKNLQIGYTLPQLFTKRISIESARIYFSGQDLWVLDHVKGGWDPEASTTGFNYPFQKLYSFGLDVTF